MPRVSRSVPGRVGCAVGRRWAADADRRDAVMEPSRACCRRLRDCRRESASSRRLRLRRTSLLAADAVAPGGSPWRGPRNRRSSSPRACRCRRGRQRAVPASRCPSRGLQAGQVRRGDQPVRHNFLRGPGCNLPEHRFRAPSRRAFARRDMASPWSRTNASRFREPLFSRTALSRTRLVPQGCSPSPIRTRSSRCSLSPASAGATPDPRTSDCVPGQLLARSRTTCRQAGSEGQCSKRSRTTGARRHVQRSKRLWRSDRVPTVWFSVPHSG